MRTDFAVATVGENIETGGADGSSDWRNPDYVGQFNVYAENQGVSEPCVDDVVRITLDGKTPIGPNLAKPDAWPYEFADVTYGGPNELFGREWTLADIRSNYFFGLMILIRSEPREEDYPVSYLVGRHFTISTLPEQVNSIDGIEFRFTRHQHAAESYARIKNLHVRIYYS